MPVATGPDVAVMVEENGGALVWVMPVSLHVLSATARTSYPAVWLDLVKMRSFAEATGAVNPCTLNRRKLRTTGSASTRNEVDVP